MFPGYLSNAQMQPLIEAAITSDLVNVPRQALLAGLPAPFALSLQGFANVLDQFQGDLTRLNAVERLADGQVPLVTYLGNAAFQLRLRGREETRLFQQAQAGIGNVAAGVSVDLPSVDNLPEVITKEQIIGTDDAVGLAFLAGGIEVAQAVAMITVPRFEQGVQVSSNGGPWVLRGTAWLIGPGLALTNHHVINARRSDEAPAAGADLLLQATGASLAFGFDAADASPAKATVTGLVASSPDLDYALLAVAGAPDVPIPRLDPQPVTVDATSRMAVNIIQHPRGEPKQVALRNNLVTAADADTVRYFTDTDYGSSGSPVCDDRWRVVALHRGARHAPDTNYQGKTESYVNFGSQIQAVLADIRAKAPAAADGIATAQA